MRQPLHTSAQPRLRATSERRGHSRPRAAAFPGADAADARRARDAGGPEDQATYRCSCGIVFQASVSTSVACPSCGTGQDW